MNKTDLITAVSTKLDITKKDADKSINAFLDAITEALADGDKISIAGFGTFTVREREARIGKNPRTGEDVEIKACNIPSFKPGSALKEAVNTK